MLRMNCNELETRILLLARNHLMDASLRERCLEHVQLCIRCAGRLEEEKALLQAIESAASEVAKEEAPRRIEASLLEAFREQAALLGPTSKHTPSRRWIPVQLAAAAAAIIFLASIATWSILHKGSVQKQSANNVSTGHVTTPVQPEKLKSGGENVAQVNQNSEKQSRVRRRHWAHKTQPEEQVTEFFPLVDGIDLNSLEAFQLVRLELPIAELRNLGLPMLPENSADSVKADVVFGQDGRAQAIRFVP